MLIDGTKRNQEENTMIGGQPSANITGTSTVGQTGSKGPTQSGSFTNLNKYIQANQGANNQTINKLNTTAQNTAGQAQSAINQAKTVGTTAQQNLDKYQQDQGFVKSSLEDPLKNVNFDRFTQLRTGFNANPAQEQSQFDTATAQANATRTQKANELQNYTTSGGLTDWLRTQRQSPRYSQGSQSLDKFLIKGTNEGAQALQNIGQQAKQFQAEPEDFNTIRQGIQTRAQALDPNLMSAEQIQNATNQRIAQERQALNDWQNQQSYTAGKNNAITAGTYRGEDVIPLNIGGEDLIDRGGESGASGQANALIDYMRANDTGAIVNRFTPEQVARYTALARMAGTDPTEALTANEQAYQTRLGQQKAVEQRYVQERADAQAQAEAEMAEYQRQQQEQAHQDAIARAIAAMYGRFYGIQAGAY